jgi:hypothetical protein
VALGSPLALAFEGHVQRERVKLRLPVHAASFIAPQPAPPAKPKMIESPPRVEIPLPDLSWVGGPEGDDILRRIGLLRDKLGGQR